MPTPSPFFCAVISLLMFCVPASAILIPKLTLPLLLVLSLFGMIFRAKGLVEVKKGNYLYNIVLVYIVIYFVINYHHNTNWGGYHTPVTLLLIIPFIWLLQVPEVKVEYAYFGSIFGAISAACIAILTAGPNSRAGGALNPIIFAGLALLLAVASTAAAKYVPSKLLGRYEGAWLAFTVMAVLGALLSVILSGSKSAVLVVPFLIWLVAPLINQLIFKSRHLAWCIFALMSVISCVAIFNSVFFSRVLSTFTAVKGWIFNHNVEIHDGSVIPRFELWQLGISIIKEYPLLGVGRLGVIEEIKKAASMGLLNSEYSWAQTLHNEVINVWATSGLFGLFATLAVFAAILHQGFRARSQKHKSLATLSFGLFWTIVIFGVGEVAISLIQFRTLVFFYLLIVIGQSMREISVDRSA